MSETAYIALGSNLDDPVQQLKDAVQEIAQLDGVTLTACSKFYRSAPMGPQDQPDYCNAVVEIKTTLAPIALLDAMQQIEQQHGRVRTIRWGARTLDLDILLFGEQRINTERLTVPHYQMHLRNFVLIPLSDIRQELQLPDGESLQARITQLGNDGLVALD